LNLIEKQEKGIKEYMNYAFEEYLEDAEIKNFEQEVYYTIKELLEQGDNNQYIIETIRKHIKYELPYKHIKTRLKQAYFDLALEREYDEPIETFLEKVEKDLEKIKNEIFEEVKKEVEFR